MLKISIVGAGSTVFAKNLIGDILSFPELADATISLFDIDPARLHTSQIVAHKVADALGVDRDACAYMGDDLPDLPALLTAGLPIAVADAAQEVRDAASWITHAPGGRGAIREVAQAILSAQGIWQTWLERWHQQATH